MVHDECCHGDGVVACLPLGKFPLFAEVGEGHGVGAAAYGEAWWVLIWD